MAGCSKCDGPLQGPPNEGPVQMGSGVWWCWRCFQESLPVYVDHNLKPIDPFEGME